MVAWLPSIPYPPARDDGYWAPITSTLDWCEENYYATQYSAEIVNTLTNLLFVYLAFRGARNCIQHGHDQIFLVTFIGYFLVGSGSFAFHSTLKYPWQLVDELSMIYTTCLMCWATFSHKRQRWVQIAIGLGVAALAIFITLYYHYLQDPTFHQNAYAILTIVVLGRSMYIMERDIRPYFRGRQEEHERMLRDASVSGATRLREPEKDDRDRWILTQMWTMIILGLAMFLGAFAIWTLDNEYCGTLRKWRHEIGLPWGLLLEGHGWWHLGTGTGAYFYIVWGIWLRHCLNGRADEYELEWPSVFTSLPGIVRNRKPLLNGSAKKLS
ncbi:alkaline dihydroceramidase Ydc1 [Sphaerulina musiva SO2202]|uniref:Alkaline dihydroceramidase Ydc1 n=1 Tax=Sphaerulina musiva (strain SO2202) TaxID=692275 RepID=N1QI42_SPHMS|nr:alkaline dihydroceramidase Ydc1 [Sphaerulina musiva SO2202]EMF16865.1 alkaline dihydroceramidase Ydc1 [Sphaerulina musiva SO2202]